MLRRPETSATVNDNPINPLNPLLKKVAAINSVNPSSCSVGALLALASGKAERRQVHPLKEKRCINIVDTPFVILWVVMDSNHRRHSQQIYSLPHLATLVTTQKLLICELPLFDKSFVLKSECKGSAFFSFHQIFLHLFSLFSQKTSFFP